MEVEMNNLKDYRDRELSLYIIANVLIFLIVHRFIRVDLTDIPAATKVLADVFSSVVFSAIAFGFILVVECLFTSEFKENLLYLFGLLKMPGSTIFSKIKNKDSDVRFSYQTLKEKYPELYEDLPADKKARLRYENEHWYSIYSQCRETSMIYYSQRDWLLCRDIFISTFLMIIMYAIVSILHFATFNPHYTTFLIILLVITAIGANRKAVRFAFNVIAYDLNRLPEKEKIS